MITLVLIAALVTFDASWPWWLAGAIAWLVSDLSRAA